MMRSAKVNLSESSLKLRACPRLLSFIIPLYNEQESIPKLRERLESLVESIPCPVEWIVINDGSTDATGQLLNDWAIENPNLKVLEFSRNFGQAAATTAGLDCVEGEVTVIMDGDLQDPPELVLQMLEMYQRGYDIIYAQRKRRHGESWLKILTAQLFYRCMQHFFFDKLPQNVGDFRMLSQEVVSSLRHLREGHRFIRGMTCWVGFKQIAIQFDRPQREAGVTKWPIYKMIQFAFDGIFSFSSLPLKLGTYLGFILLLIGMGFGCNILIRKLYYGEAFVQGWTTLVMLLCGIGGAILGCLGLIGEYVGRIYEEVKGRPLYIVKSTKNLSLKSEQYPMRSIFPNFQKIPVENKLVESSLEPDSEFERIQAKNRK